MSFVCLFINLDSLLSETKPGCVAKEKAES